MDRSISDGRGSPPIALYAGIFLAFVLVAFYLKVIIPFVRFPADLLMWGETDFTGNIIRLRGGYPMYSPPADINSSTYPPLASIITYLIVTVLRLPVEVPVLRTVQMGFVAAAAFVGLGCWRLLRTHLFPDAELPHGRAWAVLTLLTVFLVSTAPETGQWIHTLHTDALSLLWSVVSFAALLWYLRSPGKWSFAALCLLPAVGFAVKQYLLIWAPINFFTLLIDEPREWRRLLWLFLITTACTAIVVGTGYLLWGPNFFFWVFEVVGGARSRIGFSAGGYEMSVPRAADHLLRAWAPLSFGFLGGWLVLRRDASRRAAALWAPWLVLIAAEAMTSGTGWDALYHFGPGAVIGVIWLMAALPEVWPERGGGLPMLVRSAWAFGGLLVIYLAIDAVPSGRSGQQRYWRRALPEESQAFVQAIEREFDGMDPAEVLMDWGNWTYLDANYLQRDRAISMADFPTVGRYDLLEPLLRRIRERTYAKILVHGLDDPTFIYDWTNLDRPTGVREALRENYDLVRVIPGLEVTGAPQIQFAEPVYVLVPKP